MFQLTDDEAAILIFQSGISSFHGGRRHNPYAFTEQGVAMLHPFNHVGKSDFTPGRNAKAPVPPEEGNDEPLIGANHR